MIRLKHRMLFGQIIEVFDGDIKYHIEKKNRKILIDRNYREDFEIDGVCFVKDTENKNETDGRIRLFEIFINGEFWTDISIKSTTLFDFKEIYFGSKDLCIEKDLRCHNYSVYFNGKKLFTNTKKLFSRFYQIDIYDQSYRYHALALAIAIDRASHYDIFDNMYW